MDEISKEQTIWACVERARLREHGDVERMKFYLNDLFDGDGFSIIDELDEQEPVPDTILK